MAQGAKAVVCHPFFLSPGRHATEDIPRMLADAAAKYPEVPESWWCGGVRWFWLLKSHAQALCCYAPINVSSRHSSHAPASSCPKLP